MCFDLSEIQSCFHLQLLYFYYVASPILSLLTCLTLTLSIFSTHWETAKLNMNYLKENLPLDLTLTEYASGKLVLLIPGNNSQGSAQAWPYNPSILAETHSGLWDTCLAVSGRLSFIKKFYF